MNFKVGDTVVYPHHGAARVEDIVVRTIKGEEVEYLVLKVADGDMTVQIPSSKLEYVARGYSIAGLDCRGQGGESEDSGGVKGNTLRGHIIRGLDDSPDNLLFRHIYLDTAQLAGLVMGMPEVDPRRVGVYGGSQGGGLTLACAALEPRVKLAAPTVPFLSDFKRVWELDLAKDA